MRSEKLAVVASIGVTALALFGSAAPAQATTSTSSPDGGAWGKFESYGEHFYLKDSKCDGHSVYIDYKIAGTSKPRIANDGGCNTQTDTNLSLSEGTRVEYKVCTQKEFAPDSCSTWITDYA